MFICNGQKILLKVNFADERCCLLQVCPICAMRVGVDMVAHITLQHGNIFKISFSLELLLALKVAISVDNLMLFLVRFVKIVFFFLG